eukprot:4169804-Prymnesium_polylepis.3
MTTCADDIPWSATTVVGPLPTTCASIAPKDVLMEICSPALAGDSTWAKPSSEPTAESMVESAQARRASGHARRPADPLRKFEHVDCSLFLA